MQQNGYTEPWNFQDYIAKLLCTTYFEWIKRNVTLQVGGKQ